MLTGEPDAGNPLVRFGGRGAAIQCGVPTPIQGAMAAWLGADSNHPSGMGGWGDSNEPES